MPVTFVKGSQLPIATETDGNFIGVFGGATKRFPLSRLVSVTNYTSDMQVVNSRITDLEQNTGGTGEEQSVIFSQNPEW